MISFTRGNQVGSAARSATIGPRSRHHKPLPYSCAACSAARIALRANSAYIAISPSICCTWGWLALIASAMRVARPQAKVSLVCARIMVCCMMLGHQLVFITLL